MQKESRPKIPEPIKRKVRQDCGFACVICGIPIFDYDHISPWAETQSHDPNNLVLLCPTHHAEKTRGLLPAKQVAEARANPYSVRNKQSKPHPLHFSGPQLSIILGGSFITATPRKTSFEFVALNIDGRDILGFAFEDEQIYLNATFYDSTGDVVLSINKNQVLHYANSWDIEFKGPNLVIREQQREILLDLLFDVPSKVSVQRGELYAGKRKVSIDPTQISVDQEYKLSYVNCGFWNTGLYL